MEATTVSTGRVRAGGSTLRQRLAAACGALFVLGIVIGDDTINSAGEPPSPLDHKEDSIGEVTKYLDSAADAATSGSYWVGRGIGTLALLALLIFAVYVSRMIRSRERESTLLSGLTLGAGIAAVALALTSAAAQFAVVARANEGIDPEIARAMLDFSGIAFVLAWAPLAVFLGAMAVAGRRLAILPRWLAVSAAVLAVALAIGLAAMPAGGAGFMAIVLSGLWFIAASVALARRVGVQEETA
jgi:hypothetical protein